MLVVVFILVLFEHLDLLLQLLYLELELLLFHYLQTTWLSLANAHLVHLSLEVRYLLYFLPFRLASRSSVKFFGLAEIFGFCSLRTVVLAASFSFFATHTRRAATCSCP